jgi:hypothetical protein
MIERPDWLEKQTTEEVLALFRAHGVSDGVSVIPTADSEEAIFFVDSTNAANMRQAPLTAALTDLLRRKVWIITDLSAWREVPVPLVPPRGDTRAEG